MEFHPGILCVKPPMDGGLGGITLPLQGLDFPAEGGLVGDTLLEAATSQDAELDLRHVEPTAVLGRVVELSRFTIRRASAAGKAWYREAGRWVFRLSMTTRTTWTSG